MPPIRAHYYYFFASSFRTPNRASNIRSIATLYMFGRVVVSAGYQEGEEEGDHHSGRKIAIILGGGAAALLIGLIFLSLLGCVSRKDGKKSLR